MENPIVSARAQQEYVQAIYHRYRGARRPEKQRILDEFCQVTKHHRKHAIRLLNRPAPGAATHGLGRGKVTASGKHGVTVETKVGKVNVFLELDLG